MAYHFSFFIELADTILYSRLKNNHLAENSVTYEWFSSTSLRLLKLVRNNDPIPAWIINFCHLSTLIESCSSEFNYAKTIKHEEFSNNSLQFLKLHSVADPISAWIINFCQLSILIAACSTEFDHINTKQPSINMKTV